MAKVVGRADMKAKYTKHHGHDLRAGPVGRRGDREQRTIDPGPGREAAPHGGRRRCAGGRVGTLLLPLRDEPGSADASGRSSRGTLIGTSPKTETILMSAKLQGIFTPNIVPLADDGSINEPELRRYIDWLIDQRRARAVSQRLDRRVHPLHARGAAADHRDRLRPDGAAACRCWPARPRPTSARRSPPARPMPATARGPWPSSRRSTTSSAPSRSTPTSARSPCNSPIDVTLYNIPMFASPIDVPTIQRLAEFERIVGDQGFVGRPGVHDAHDRGRAARSGPTSPSSPAGTRCWCRCC